MKAEAILLGNAEEKNPAPALQVLSTVSGLITFTVKVTLQAVVLAEQSQLLTFRAPTKGIKCQRKISRVGTAG